MKVGADPEVFLHNGKHFVSVEGKLGGTKYDPLPIRELGDGYFVQEDNVAAEYNVPPCDRPEELVFANKAVLSYIEKRVKPLGLHLNFSTDAIFPEKEVSTEQGRTFGCDPDFNAWEIAPNDVPKSKNPFLRGVGGHIHIGLPNVFTDYDKIMMVRWLDLYVGAPLCYFEKSNLRREQAQYGRAGAMRFKPYGLEYRVPSNIWIREEGLTHAIFAGIQKCISLVKDRKDPNKHRDVVERAINKKEVDAVLHCKKYLDSLYMT